MENFKYELVSIDTMNSQINLRLSEKLLNTSKKYAFKHGFTNVQEFIRDTIREKLFSDNSLSSQELQLIKQLLVVSESKNLYGSEKDLFKKLTK